MKRYAVLVLVAIHVILLPCLAGAGDFVAFSLKEAEKRFSTGTNVGRDAKDLGGITDLAGMVYDKTKRDWIIVGQINAGKPKITMDDLVVAMRAVFIHRKCPLVSIDRTSETSTSRKQIIRYEGGIEGSQLAMDMLQSDVILKKMALNKLRANIWGLHSYVSMMGDEARQGNEERRIGSRFWFKNVSPSLAVRDGVFAIMKLDVGVETEVLYAEIGGKPVSDFSGIRDKVGDKFADQVAMNLSDLGAEYPVLARARPILALVALAEGMKTLQAEGDLAYWLSQYRVSPVDTPKTFDLIEVSEEIQGKSMRLTVNGGMELNPIVVKLNKGYVTALKEAVLSSRPAGNALTWHPPLDGWQIPGAETSTVQVAPGQATSRKSGFSLDGALYRSGSVKTYSPSAFGTPQIAPPKAQLPSFSIHENLAPQTNSDRVGGVKLEGTASVVGAAEAKVEASGNNFSLVVEGKNAQLDPTVFRKFVTALWSVYFTAQDPGISIDPIGPGIDKHLVRYIGKVVNTDLGRVMRETDYMMKKWAVGTDRPNIPGFRNPDDIAAQKGTLYVGAMSRFWFVPENMRFKQADNMLLFDSGRMAVRTEFAMGSTNAKRADPANEEFARFLTNYYGAISERYPIYQELFDYAKMVSLAKYLKDSGVPLFWFLMANKDLVLTEDSPGSVNALAKSSDHFRNITIEGGVDLSTKGQYVFDQAAVTAIRQAQSRSLSDGGLKTSLGEVPRYVPGSLSFDLKGQSYSVVPQHSLTSGNDRRGIRYQTDLALRAQGYAITAKVVDSLRPDIHRRLALEKVRPTVEKMPRSTDKSRLNDLLTSAWKETEPKVDSIISRLASLKDKDFRSEAELASALKASLGAEATNRLGDLIVKEAHYTTNLELVRYFDPQQRDVDGDFGQGWQLLIPYRIKPASTEKRNFLNAVIPTRMEVLNLFSGEREELTFSEDRYAAAGYVPDRLERSQLLGLFLLSDLSYRLRDKLGNEFQFDPSGSLTEMIFSDECRIKIEYGYAQSAAGKRYTASCRIEPYGNERESFLNVRLPNRMKLIDPAGGREEILFFNKDNKRGIAGYTPEDSAHSRYEILALMSDGSFVLTGKDGEEIRFDRAGRSEGKQVSIVKALSQGNTRIEFRHDLSHGEPRIVEACVTKGSQATPVYVVKYEYGPDQRLCNVTNSAVRKAEASCVGAMTMAAK